MAISISNIGTPFHKVFQIITVSSHHQISFPFLGQTLQIPTKIKRPKSELLSKTNNFLAYEDEKGKHLHDGVEQGNTQQPNERKLSDCWKKIHGEEDWVGLLDPMDPLLRAELLRYGEMAQACYDAFDYDPFSKYCGSSKYSPQNFFQGVGMRDHGHEVSRYLYATSNITLPNFFKKSRWPEVWSRTANWIGYVAVSNHNLSKYLGRRVITVAWRGTVTELEWVTDLIDYLRPVSSKNIPCPDPEVKVESGFLDLYTDKDESCKFCMYSAREQILAEIKRLMEMYAGEELSITITGHSLGGALAILSAYDIVETGINVMADSQEIPVSVFTFSGPRVGNVRFKERVEQLGLKALRVVNVHDMVPKLPGLIFNETLPVILMKLVKGSMWSYSHIGVELALDHNNSPFLKQKADLISAHNMEAHLHLLDGYRGKGQRFVSATGRDIALVNKASDFLKDDYLVPPNWRQDENKGMIRTEDGLYTQPERPKLNDHSHHILNRYLRQLGFID